MLGSKGLLTPLIPGCFALRALTIRKNIHNPLIFLRKMASYSCFCGSQGQKSSYKQACIRFSDLLTLVSYHYCNTKSEKWKRKQNRRKKRYYENCKNFPCKQGCICVIIITKWLIIVLLSNSNCSERRIFLTGFSGQEASDVHPM